MHTSVRVGRLIMRVRPAPLGAALKWLLRVKRVEAKTAHGTLWVDPASYQGLRILETGTYEPELVAILQRFLKPGGVFVDLGANEGFFSVVAGSLAGSSGRIVAIEPQLRLQPVLRKNFELNGLANASVVMAAITDKEGEAQMHLTPGVNNSASSLSRPTKYPLLQQKVHTLTLEQVFNAEGIDRCSLIKIDVEGWEYEAILGSKRLFEQRRIKAIAMELHPRFLAARGLDAAAIVSFLTSCGYRGEVTADSLVMSCEPDTGR